MRQTARPNQELLCGRPQMFPVTLLFLLLVSTGVPGLAAAQEANASAVADSAAIAEALADSLEQEAVVDTLPELTEALDLLSQMGFAMDSLLVYEQRIVGTRDEERALLLARVSHQVTIVNESPAKLLELIPKIEGTGAPVDSIREVFAGFLIEKLDIYVRTFDNWTEEIDELRSQRGVTSPNELGALEASINEARLGLGGILEGMLITLTAGDSLRLDTTEAWEEFDRLLQNNVQTLTGRMQIAISQRNKLSQRVKDEESAGAPESEIGSDRIQLRYAERRVQGIAKSLDATVQLLQKRGVDTTEYKRFTIRATGEITEDLLNPKVLAGLIKDFAGEIWQWLKDNLPTVLVRFFIVVAFVLVFRLALLLLWRLVRVFRLAKMSRLTAAMVDGLIRPIGTIVGLFAGLGFLGVNPTTLLTGVGVASVIIGLALQESLSNLAAGFFILATRPYDVDDVVKTGTVLGTVKAMGLANTTIRTFDGVRLMVPNRRIWGEVIENRSAEMARRVDITVRISYDQDLDSALQLLRSIVTDDERVLKKPEPEIFVLELHESWIVVAVRPWVKNQDWWPLLTQLPRLVRLRFAEAGVEIPFPRSEVAFSGNVTPSEAIETDKQQKT